MCRFWTSKERVSSHPLRVNHAHLTSWIRQCDKIAAMTFFYKGGKKMLHDRIFCTLTQHRRRKIPKAWRIYSMHPSVKEANGKWSERGNDPFRNDLGSDWTKTLWVSVRTIALAEASNHLPLFSLLKLSARGTGWTRRWQLADGLHWSGNALGSELCDIDAWDVLSNLKSCASVAAFKCNF